MRFDGLVGELVLTDPLVSAGRIGAWENPVFPVH